MCGTPSICISVFGGRASGFRTQFKNSRFSISHAACHGPARHETICKWTGFDGCNPFAIPLEHGRLADSLPFVLPLRAPARGSLLFPLQHTRRPIICDAQACAFLLL